MSMERVNKIIKANTDGGKIKDPQHAFEIYELIIAELAGDVTLDACVVDEMAREPIRRFFMQGDAAYRKARKRFKSKPGTAFKHILRVFKKKFQRWSLNGGHYPVEREISYHATKGYRNNQVVA